MNESVEAKRLVAARNEKVPWRKWGPYLSERQWGTVAKTTARMEMPGITSPTTRPARAPITGAKTVLPASAMTNNFSASPRAVEWQGSNPEGASLRA